MGRILALDYGRKRVGIAVTDPLQLIANALATVHPDELLEFLSGYFGKEAVDAVVVGDPRKENMEASDSASYIRPFVRKFRERFPGTELRMFDERYTSRLAGRALIEGGAKMKTRRDKPLRDRMSAAILLTSYLEYMKNAEERKQTDQ